MSTRRQNRLTLLLVAATLAGCSPKPDDPVPPLPAQELFVVLPRGLPIACGEAVRAALRDYIESAPPGTSLNFFLGENQELLGSTTIPEGSKAYRRKVVDDKLAKVFERLDPEMTGGSQSVDLLSVPASVRKYRKRDDAAPRVVVIGSPLIEDREQGNSVGDQTLPCDGCVGDPQSSYGRMPTFPEGTTVAWLTPRADYGAGPNHREQVEHFLRYLLQQKKAPLVRMSSDAGVVFGGGRSQWDGPVDPADDCNGSKEVAPDEAQPTRFDHDGKTKVVALRPDLTIRVRRPDPQHLKGQADRVLFLPDTSASVAWDPDGTRREEVFDAIKRDVCAKLDAMPFAQFAVCGFGGWHNVTPRLSKHPCSLLSGMYWEEGTRANRDRAIEFVKGLKAGGGTPTYAALEEALKLEGPLTVILYSDGVPTIGAGGQPAVLELGKTLLGRGVTVNAVGVGPLAATNDDFDWSGGEFLKRLADATEGEYFSLE